MAQVYFAKYVLNNIFIHTYARNFKEKKDYLFILLLKAVLGRNLQIRKE